LATTTRRSSAITADRRAAGEARTLAVVEELLREGVSFTELSVERIAVRAGLSRSTFYLYFRDKTELMLRLSESLKAGTYELGEDWRPFDSDDGLEWLATAYEKIIEKYRERSATLAAVIEVAGYDRPVRESLAANQQRFIARIAARLAEEQRAGRTSGDIDPVSAAQVMVWGGEQVILKHVTTNAGDDARVARELASSNWYGVYRRPATAAGPTE
jgi:AcrR family transcriptional regulator